MGDPGNVLSTVELEVPPVGRLLMRVASVPVCNVDNVLLSNVNVSLLESEERLGIGEDLDKDREETLVGRLVATELSVGRESVADIDTERLADGMCDNVIEDVKVRTIVVVPVVSRLVTTLEEELLAPVEVRDCDVPDPDVGNPVEIPEDDG